MVPADADHDEPRDEVAFGELFRPLLHYRRFIGRATVALTLLHRHRKFGIWALSTHAGINFWMGVNPEANGYYHLPDSLPFDSSDQGKMDRAAWKPGWEYTLK